MSYNLKCCSFYPNNFDASALTDGYAALYVLAYCRCSWSTLFFGIGIDYLSDVTQKLKLCSIIKIHISTMLMM